MKFIRCLGKLFGVLSMTTPAFFRVCVAFAGLLTLSAVAQAATVATPTFSPVAGTYTSAQTVTITTTTSGASIRYTTNGSTPSSTAGTLYSGPVNIGVTTTLKAIAYKSGSTNSSVRTGAYTIQAAAPTFSPVAGPYIGTQSVTITTTTSGASIRYTTNGTTPSSTVGTLYVSGSPVSIEVTTTLKAIAFKSGLSNSTVTTGTYTIQVMPPVFSPVAGTYGSAQSVTITTGTSGATIRYTTNGTTPSSTVGMVYAGPVNIAATTTLKAIAYKTGMTNSTVTSGTYTINPTPVPVIASATAATGQVGAAFSYQITASNSPTSYAASPLPAGVTVNTTTGLISGTPTTAGATSVNLTATNAGGTSTAMTLTITVNPASPVITSATAATGQVGVAFSYQITASNSPTSYAASPMPAGVTVNTTTGLISGTPTTAGATSVSLTATNVGGTGTAVTLTITVNPASPVITPPAPTSGQTGAAFSYQVTASNSPNSFSATGLPPGLSINTSTGLISGTPTAPGIYTVTIGASNTGGTSAPVTLTITILASLPYTADFEPAEGYVLGSLNGQLGWTVDTGVSVVSNQDFAHATQSVQLSPGNPPPVIGQTFASSPGQTVEFFDIFAKPVAGTPPGTASTFTIEESEFAFQLSGNQGVLQAFNGNGAGGGSWVATPFTIPLGAGNQATNWVRLTTRLDFSQQKWDLYANAQMVAADIPFIGSSTYLSNFQLQGDGASTSGLDYLYAGPTNPLFADINNNGIDDVWETTHGLSLAANNRNTSPTGNGVTVVQAYVNGTNPNDFYNGASPTLTIVSGNNQAADAEQFNAQPFVVSVKNAAGIAPLVNAPVIFTVQSGGGKLALGNTGSATEANAITVTTDVNGMAQLYYRQPASASVQSVVSVTAGNAQISFTTESATPPVPKTIDGLRLFLKADAGTEIDAQGKINSWADQSVFGNTATQTVAGSRPLLVSGELNGWPVVRFAGSQYLALPNLMAGAGAGEIFAVLKSTAQGGGQWQFSNSPSNYGPHYPWNDGQIYESFGSTVRPALGVPSTPLNSFNLYNVSSQANDWVVRLNRVELVHNTVNTVQFRTDPAIGQNLGGYYFTGDFAEIIIYDHVLSALEREKVNIYLGLKYALFPPPVAPSVLGATAMSSTQVSLSWSVPPRNDDAVYEIERRTAGSGDFVKVGETLSNLSYVDSGLTAGTNYEYRVRMRAYLGTGGYSPVTSIRTLDGSAPEFPLIGMRLWLKAGSISSGVWSDQSGLGNHAVVASASNPPTVVADAVNGLPVVRFNGANQAYNLPNLMNGATAGEMFMVLKVSDANRFQNSWSFGSGNLGRYPYAAGTVYDYFGTAGGKQFPVSAALDSYHLYDVNSQLNSWQARFNGGLAYSTTTNSVVFTTTFNIGGNSNYGDLSFAGDIAEVIVYDHVLTAAERESVNTYLGSKYALYPAPVTPAALSATAISNAQVSLVWSGPLRSDQVAYEIERKTGSGSFVKVGETLASVSYIDSGLAAGIEYTYRVRMRAYTGISAYSAESTVTSLSSGLSDMPASGIRLWLKADAVASGGLGVALWPDQSGLGNHAISVSGSNQPKLIGNALNGHPVVRFNGANQAYSLPNLMNGATAGEMFMVLKVSDANRFQNSWSFGSGNLGRYPYAAGTVYDYFGTASGKQFLVSTALDAYHLYDVNSQLNSWQARFNGGLAYSTTTNSVVFTTTINIGGNSSYGDLSFAGDIAEVIIYDHVLTAEERESTNFYLNHKYALALPVAVTGGANRDTNRDGLTDAQDVAAGIDPYSMDVDGDGIPNSTEIANGTNPFAADTDHDGVSDATDAFPTDPLRWDMANTPPTLTSISGNNQIAQTGLFNPQPLSVTVMNSAGTAPLINAPVAFTVLSGGGQLALTTAGTPTLTSTVNLLTDTNGQAKVYFQQPGTAYTPSSILFTAGSAQTTFTSTSTVTGDIDNNGLSDAWEIQNFTHTGVDPNADPDGDGLTNLQEFQQGTNPNDFYNAILPTLAIVSGNNQTGPAGLFTAQPVVISVKNVAGTAPMVNAPVTFTVLTEGGRLALTNIGSPVLSTTLTISTDASGTVQVFYQQPVTPDLVSTILVTAGLSQAVINTSNFIPVNGPVDSDSDGLPDAWEQQYFGHLSALPSADPDADGLTNLQEFQLGRNPIKGEVPDTTGAVNLRVYSPNR